MKDSGREPGRKDSGKPGKVGKNDFFSELPERDGKVCGQETFSDAAFSACYW